MAGAGQGQGDEDAEVDVDEDLDDTAHPCCLYHWGEKANLLWAWIESFPGELIVS
jgi:hypothetical protein